MSVFKVGSVLKCCDKTLDMGLKILLLDLPLFFCEILVRLPDLSVLEEMKIPIFFYHFTVAVNRQHLFKVPSKVSNNKI